MDNNMHEFAEFQIGDKVYNCKTNEIGVITKHYRYFEDIDNDNTFSVYCKINCPEGSMCYDNTSRYGSLHPYVKKEDYENNSEYYINKLKLLAVR